MLKIIKLVYFAQDHSDSRTFEVIVAAEATTEDARTIVGQEFKDLADWKYMPEYTKDRLVPAARET